jgi:prepilin-type N-terminal cleavage/methylation domain-containing protein
MSRSGFTLLEVLLALLLITSGVLALIQALGAATRLGATGRERGRIALALQSRAAWIESEARRNLCAPPPAGAADRADGLRETWNTRLTGRTLEALIIVTPPRSPRRDTLLVRWVCP